MAGGAGDISGMELDLSNHGIEEDGICKYFPYQHSNKFSFPKVTFPI